MTDNDRDHAGIPQVPYDPADIPGFIALLTDSLSSPYPFPLLSHTHNSQRPAPPSHTPAQQQRDRDSSAGS